MNELLFPYQKEIIQNKLRLALKVLREFDWLLDLYVLDFFVDNHWDKLPVTWRQSFNNIDPQSLGDIYHGAPVKLVLPLSFLALLKTMKHLCMPRDVKIQNHTECNNVKDSTDLFSNHPKLNNLFLKHVKLKKRHEISLMAKIVKDVASVTKCNAVVDFGSGLGHLIRVLSYKYGIHSAGIECQSQLTEEARKLDLELEYTASKQMSEQSLKNLCRPTHYNMHTSSQRQLANMSLPKTLQTYGLVGLHPCGDLGPLLLKHFASCKKVQFVCLVGCCYMKLTETGYPMSDFVRSLDSKLSYPSREIACHAIEVYHRKLSQGEYENLKIHAYRAAFELILADMDPNLRHTEVRSIKHTNSMTFERYCELALERLEVGQPTKLSLQRAEEAVKNWRKVVALYSLRLLLAPLVETIILLDRQLFILEHGSSCEVRPIFDPELSPRNHIMIARKQ